MAASMRRVVTNFTDIVFPQGNVTVDRQQLHLQKPGNELVSSLPWQMSLYFNVYFFPIWLVTNLITFYLKFHYLDMLYQIILITIFITITAVEIIRLYLGYLGNLCEKVPELAGSWLLTLVLQCPLLAFLLFTRGTVILPLEQAVNAVMMAFVLVQIVAGYSAVKAIAGHQVVKFHMRQYEALAETEDSPTLLRAAES